MVCPFEDPKHCCGNGEHKVTSNSLQNFVNHLKVAHASKGHPAASILVERLVCHHADKVAM